MHLVENSTVHLAGAPAGICSHEFHRAESIPNLFLLLRRNSHPVMPNGLQESSSSTGSSVLVWADDDSRGFLTPGFASRACRHSATRDTSESATRTKFTARALSLRRPEDYYSLGYSTVQCCFSYSQLSYKKHLHLT